MIDVEPIALDDPNLAEQFANLVEHELGGGRSLEQIKRLLDFSTGQTMVIGGLIEGRLVCVNAFMPQTFYHRGQPLLGFQSGFSATHSDFRGKGLWPRLMIEAEDRLRQRGAAFLFGFPNAVSHPLFVKKLGYTSTDVMMELLVVSFPFLSRMPFRKVTPVPSEDHIRPDLAQTLEWKRRSSLEGVFRHEGYGGSLWGKRRTPRRLGIPIPYLAIGGYELDDRSRARALILDAMRGARVRVAQLQLNRDHSDFDLFAFRQVGLPVIIKPVGDFQLGNARVDFTQGMFDTF